MPRRNEVHQTVFLKWHKGRIRQNYSIAVLGEWGLGFYLRAVRIFLILSWEGNYTSHLIAVRGKGGRFSPDCCELEGGRFPPDCCGGRGRFQLDCCELGGGSDLIAGIEASLRSADSWRLLCGWSPCLQWPPCLRPPPPPGSWCSVRPPRPPRLKYKQQWNRNIYL